MIFLSNGPAALDLGGKHHGECYNIARLIEVDFFDVLVGKRYVNVLRQCGGKSHGAMRRKIESRLPAQFLPLRVDQFHFNSVHNKVYERFIIRFLKFAVTIIIDPFDNGIQPKYALYGVDSREGDPANAMQINTLAGQQEVTNPSNR